MGFSVNLDPLGGESAEARFLKVADPHQKVAIVPQDDEELPLLLLVQGQGGNNRFVGASRTGEKQTDAEKQK
jgi:hypothetical protein